MLTRLLVRMILLAAIVGGLCSEVQRLSAAQGTNVALDSSSTANEKNAGDNKQAPPTASKLDEIIDRIYSESQIRPDGGDSPKVGLLLSWASRLPRPTQSSHDDCEQ
jgi:hypothetical protein